MGTAGPARLGDSPGTAAASPKSLLQLWLQLPAFPALPPLKQSRAQALSSVQLFPAKPRHQTGSLRPPSLGSEQRGQAGMCPTNRETPGKGTHRIPQRVFNELWRCNGICSALIPTLAVLYSLSSDYRARLNCPTDSAEPCKSPQINRGCVTDNPEGRLAQQKNPPGTEPAQSLGSFILRGKKPQ